MENTISPDFSRSGALHRNLQVQRVGKGRFRTAKERWRHNDKGSLCSVSRSIGGKAKGHEFDFRATQALDEAGKIFLEMEHSMFD